MTTAAQIKKLAQPLLERNPDLAIVGRFVFFKQVDHLLRGIYVDRCGDKSAFRPAWTVDCLFNPTKDKYVGSGFGEQIYPAPANHWFINNPNMDKEFAISMEQVALPKLNTLKTIEQFSNITYHFCGQLMALDKISLRKFYVDLALGKFQQAEEAVEFFSKQPDYRSKYFHSPEHYDEIMNEVRPMIKANDKSAIATKLHEWEAYSVKQLKLEKYWQATPFPIEL
jgi:hypothetical protein